METADTNVVHSILATIEGIITETLMVEIGMADITIVVITAVEIIIRRIMDATITKADTKVRPRQRLSSVNNPLPFLIRAQLRNLKVELRIISNKQRLITRMQWLNNNKPINMSISKSMIRKQVIVFKRQCHITVRTRYLSLFDQTTQSFS